MLDRLVAQEPQAEVDPLDENAAFKFVDAETFTEETDPKLVEVELSINFKTSLNRVVRAVTFVCNMLT